MPRLNAPNQRGLTLIEVVVVAAIVAILAALFLPNFLAWLNNRRVANGLARVQGAFQEAQRQAIRTGVNCVVNLTTGTNGSLTSSTNCLPTGNRSLGEDSGFLGNLQASLQLRSSVASITFDKNGFPTGLGGTFVIALPGSGAQQKCFVISNAVGLMRSGDYLSSDTTGANPSNCTTAQL
uniref:Type 4 prepilin-like protein n=1 Tax=Cyanothece sp. (strain PCC 7425 / ATCC 29141) TaxID=395961 RepID=B8HSW7_CYAP4